MSGEYNYCLRKWARKVGIVADDYSWDELRKMRQDWWIKNRKKNWESNFDTTWDYVYENSMIGVGLK